MTSDVKAYLPSYEAVTIFHLKDLACGKRKIIKSDNIKQYTVPQFEGLTIETML